MNITCGTDIIEISRIREAIEKDGDRFLNEIYTEDEIEYCNSKKTAKFEHYAARFAAKEAIFKAISYSLKNKYELTWKDIAIKNDGSGKPKVCDIFHKLDGIKLDLSLSHCKEYAVAMCVAISDKE